MRQNAKRPVTYPGILCSAGKVGFLLLKMREKREKQKDKGIE
jgi:hypothetical protein